jgi:hypothetical protein
MKLTVEQLNNGFHQVWQNIERRDTSEFLNIQGHNFQEAIQVSSYTVIMELGKLDTSKAPGPDKINNKILKNAKYELSDIITHLFNISLKNSFIPTQWKSANIIPIPKTNNAQIATDYRPIALTSALCKVLERIIMQEIIKLTKKL